MQLGIREVASLFGVADKTVYRWVEEDGLPAHEVEGQHRFHRAEVLEWATTRDLSPSPELFGEAGDAPAVSIASALSRGGVFHDVPARDRDEALAAIVERLPIAPRDREDLAAVLAARGGFGKPGGPGVAIPHVRHPIVLDVAAPSVSLFFLAAPVDFERAPLHGDAPPPGASPGTDERRLHAVFALITPSVRVHLVMLSRLAFLVHDEGVRATLDRHAAEAEVLAAIERAEARLHASGAGE